MPRPSKAQPSAEPEPPAKSAKIPYRELAERLCDLLIQATEPYEQTSRFFVARNALSYATRLLGQRFAEHVRKTKQRAA